MIFIGLTDIASQIGLFAKGFNSIGIETLTCGHTAQFGVNNSKFDFVIDAGINDSIKNSFYFKRKLYSYIIRNRNKIRIWNKAINECDTFLFMWSTFNNDFSDLNKLKKLGKKIIVFFVGDDIRWIPPMEQEFKQYNIPPIEYNKNFDINDALRRRLSYLRNCEKYADCIFSVPNQSQLSLRPYYKFFVPIELTEFPENSHQSESNPLIVHFSTNPIFKGSAFVIDALSRLRKEGLNFREIVGEKLPYHQVIKYYFDADILIGQLLAPGGGKQEREALASGCVVLSSMRYHYPEKIPGNCPIIDVGPENIYQELKKIILDYPRREQLAKKGRPWVEKYHDVNIICKRMIEQLNSNNLKPDFVPAFFREKFIPESPNALKTYNKWNYFVKDCDWFKKYVPKGERDGLIF